MDQSIPDTSIEFSLLGTEWNIESYLYNVKDVRYRSAISKLRASSQILEIERGRHTSPKVPSHLRLCKLCNVVENGEHFVTECVIDTSERLHLLERMRSIYPDVDSLDKRQMFVLLMGSADARISISILHNSKQLPRNFSWIKCMIVNWWMMICDL